MVIKVQVTYLLDGFWKDHLQHYKPHTVSRGITLYLSSSGKLLLVCKYLLYSYFDKGLPTKL